MATKLFLMVFLIISFSCIANSSRVEIARGRAYLGHKLWPYLSPHFGGRVGSGFGFASSPGQQGGGGSGGNVGFAHGSSATFLKRGGFANNDDANVQKSESSHGGNANVGKSENSHGGDANVGKSENSHGGDANVGKSENSHGGDANVGKSENGHGYDANVGKSENGHGYDANVRKSENGHGGNVAFSGAKGDGEKEGEVIPRI